MSKEMSANGISHGEKKMSWSEQRKRSIAPSPMEIYLRDINEVPLLSAKEEKKLAYEIAAGNVSARQHMIRANLRLVVNIARCYTGKGLSLQDLIEEGNLGLLHAVELFDPAENTRFSTYGSFWIKQAMKKAIINSAKTIRIPQYMVELLAKWFRTKAQLADSLGRPPTDNEILRAADLPPGRLKTIQKGLKMYNGQQTGGSEHFTLSEQLVDENVNSPVESMIQEDDIQKMHSLLPKMDTREATVLKMRFALEPGTEPLTLKAIGEVLDLTRERVRQIEAEALAKLAKNMTFESQKETYVSKRRAS